MKIFIPFICAFIILSCNNIAIKNNIPQCPVSLLDSIEFRMDSINYYEIDYVYQDSSTIYLCLPNSNRVFVLNLNSKEFSNFYFDKKIVDKEGLVFIEKFKNSDYLIENSCNVFQVDSSGKIVRQIRKCNWQSEPVVLMSHTFETPLLYDKHKDKVFMQVLSDTTMKNPYLLPNYPIEAVVDDTGRIERFLNVSYPKTFSKNYFGMLKGYSRILSKGKLVYLFNSVDSIYQYSIEDKTFCSFPINNPFAERKTEPISYTKRKNTQVLYDHYNSQPFYFIISRNPYNGNYYIMYFHYFKLENQDGTFNNAMDRKVSILVLNDSFRVVKTIEPPNDFKFFKPLFSKEGLIWKKYNGDKKSMVMYVFKEN